MRKSINSFREAPSTYFVVEGSQGLSYGLPDGLDLGKMSTTGSPAMNVDNEKLLNAAQQLVLQYLGTDLLQRVTIHSKQTTSEDQWTALTSSLRVFTMFDYVRKSFIIPPSDTYSIFSLTHFRT